MNKKILIEISARHMHISQEDLDKLFGEGHELGSIKDLSQPGQFAAEEVVEIQTPGSLFLPPHLDFTFGKACDHNQIRILGPVREHTQVELSWSDFIALGIEPKVALSGDYENSIGGVILVGPKGMLKLEKGLICAQRHIHMSDNEAQELSIKDGQKVAVKVSGQRPVTFEDVIVRARPDFKSAFHIDTDEGNAAGVKAGDYGELVIGG